MRAIRLVLSAVTAMAIAASPRLAAADAPWIAPSAAAGAIIDAAGKPDPKALVGAGVLVARLEKGDPAKDGAAIRGALVKAGFTLLDDRSEPGLFVATLEAKSGARVRVALDAYQGSITLVARPAKTTPPGACVAIPSVDHPVYVNSSVITHDGELADGQTFWGFKTRRLADVDGDGIDDAFVPVAKKHACPEAVAWRVYAVRGSCGHDLGVVGPGSIDHAAVIATPLGASGVRPLVLVAETTAHGRRGVPEHTTTTRRFEVRRGAYALVDTKQLTGACHHCGTWTCHSP
ncbi:MAG TPA: hypothetical protein VNO30_49005 [Kofleriaceae bacterium]|nr:hypothetical protein [Kofleriaceae bacterium]